MKVTFSWKRNTPSTISGESITAMIQCTSFDKYEIDELENELPDGFIAMDIDVRDVIRRTKNDG